VWLGFASLLIFNPLPIFFRSSRFWFLKIFGRVMSSGMHTVEVCHLHHGYSSPHCPPVLRFLACVSIHCCPTIQFDFTVLSISDQLCSFTFTMSNVPVFVCAYSVGFSNEWDKCGSTSRLWPLQCVAASLPLLARLIQSLRRYFESGQHSHLINVGPDRSLLLGDFILRWTGGEVFLRNNQQYFLLFVAIVRYVMITDVFSSG
jgi:xenotropic and polytropic retrovirus receptor 1